MPKDKRLYMTFPNDFWQHPKIAPLSDGAFRTFVELNGYSRMQDLDGRIPVATARKMWKPRMLTELQKNHPERPSLTVEGDDFVIWNYSEHQQTVAERMAQSAINSANGAKGGRPPKAKRTETDSVTEQKRTQSIVRDQSQKSESELETDVTYDPESSQVGDGFGSVPDSVSALAKDVGIVDLRASQRVLEKAAGQTVSLHGAVLLAQAIVSKSARAVQDVDAYIAVVCRNSAPEVQQAYFDLDIGGVR